MGSAATKLKEVRLKRLLIDCALQAACCAVIFSLEWHFGSFRAAFFLLPAMFAGFNFGTAVSRAVNEARRP